MKTLAQYRKQNPFSKANAQSIGRLSQLVKYYTKEKTDYIIDMDVFLPSINKNLQRNFCWDLNKKRKLIESILLERNIPYISVCQILVDPIKLIDAFQIIDGKQRLSTMLDFCLDKFSIILDNKELKFSELPKDYQLAIKDYHVKAYLINDSNTELTDLFKFNLFESINFDSIPQEKDHLKEIKKYLTQNEN